MNGQSANNPFAPAFRASIAVLGLMSAGALCFVISPLIVAATLAGATALWIICRHPIGILGVLLAFMPIDYLAIEFGKFFGIPHMSLVSACTKEVPLLLLIFILWRRNGFKLITPDWFLLAFSIIATSYTMIEGSWSALALDLNFILPYFAGRMTVFKKMEEQTWAVRGVWIVAILAVVGLSEVFIFGAGPRTALYSATDAMTDNGELVASFHAVGFGGLREAAGMIGPNSFGALCMVGLVLWWVHSRNPLPGAMISAGLACSLTRSAWLGAAIAISFLAFAMNQKKRLLAYGLVALAIFAASIPILGIRDFLFFNKTGQDPSAEGHRLEIVNGANYVLEHPFGSGNAKFSRVAVTENQNLTLFETTYPTLAASYGLPAAVCFIGFLISAGRMALRRQSNLGYAAVGILVGIAMIMVVTIPLDDRRLACWVFFPVGLAMRSAISRKALPAGNDYVAAYQAS